MEQSNKDVTALSASVRELGIMLAQSVVDRHLVIQDLREKEQIIHNLTQDENEVE